MKAVSCSDNPIKGRREAATDALRAAQIIESVDKFQTCLFPEVHQGSLANVAVKLDWQSLRSDVQGVSGFWLACVVPASPWHSKVTFLHSVSGCSMYKLYILKKRFYFYLIGPFDHLTWHTRQNYFCNLTCCLQPAYTDVILKCCWNPIALYDVEKGHSNFHIVPPTPYK